MQAWLYPLTPAHSPSAGERENRSPLCGEANAPRRAGALAINRGAHRGSGSDVRLKQDGGCLFPLPEGEGQGEGERGAANQNGRTNFVGLARPAP